MKKIPKPALIQERDFPFESSISCGVETGFLELHWHKETEIYCIKSGTGKYLINGIDYSFSAGDIFIIGNNDIHLCHDDKELIMQVVMFDPILINSRTANSSDIEYLRYFSGDLCAECKKIKHSTECARLLSDILAEIEEEYNSEQKGYEMMIRSLLLRFFALVLRNNQDKPVSGKNSAQTPPLRYAVFFNISTCIIMNISILRCLNKNSGSAVRIFAGYSKQ